MTMLVVSTIISLSISWELFVYSIIVIILGICVSHLFAKKLASNNVEVQKANAYENKYILGIFSAKRTINIFSSNKLALDKLDNAFERTRKTTLKANVFSHSVVTSINNYIGYFLQYGVIIGAYVMVYFGYLNIGQAVTFSFIMQYFASPLHSVSRYKNAIDQTHPMREKFKEILEHEQEQETPMPQNNDISFKDMSFSYTEKDFMQNINLDFKTGKKYMILGKSGSGKTTLLKLILKELEPTGGAIYVSDKNLSDISKLSWYKKLAYCSQDMEIIPGTLRENIVLNAKYDKSKFSDIISSLNLNYLKDSFDVEISEDLSNFSGGELQRIAIARMLYNDGDLFIFDEFSSSLDNVNAFNIEKDILSIENKTIISVTHRVYKNLLEYYDKILILEEGKIKCFAPAKEIMEELSEFVQTNSD